MFDRLHMQFALRLVPWMAGLVVLLALAVYLSIIPRLPIVSRDESVSSANLSWPATARIEEDTWRVFAPGERRLQSASGPLSRRFRLAGTFFSFDERSDASGTESVCKAILDDVEKKTQHLIGEGETLDGIQVARIYRDHVVLRNDGREEELWLSFSTDREGAGAGTMTAQEAEPEPVPMEVSRFGTRVGEARWVLNRDALMNYYEELREDPERIGHLYVSMKPDYNEGAIAGYKLNMTGEQDFFKAAGLQEGDVVRNVNSLRMTSQARAEYFIGEFLQGRLSAVVLDIERGGEEKKLIYLIR